MVSNKTVEYVAGEGLTFGLGTHSIDQALVLFGKPASVTAFFRSLRGIESEVDDTFTIILQYNGEKKDLLVTIKTTIVSHMEDQFKTFIRGTKGSFIKVSFSSMNLRQFQDLVLTEVHSSEQIPRRSKPLPAKVQRIKTLVLSLRVSSGN